MRSSRLVLPVHMVTVATAVVTVVRADTVVVAVATASAIMVAAMVTETTTMALLKVAPTAHMVIADMVTLLLHTARPLQASIALRLLLTILLNTHSTTRRIRVKILMLPTEGMLPMLLCTSNTTVNRLPKLLVKLHPALQDMGHLLLHLLRPTQRPRHPQALPPLLLLALLLAPLAATVQSHHLLAFDVDLDGNSLANCV